MDMMVMDIDIERWEDIVCTGDPIYIKDWSKERINRGLLLGRIILNRRKSNTVISGESLLTYTFQLKLSLPHGTALIDAVLPSAA